MDITVGPSTGTYHKGWDQPALGTNDGAHIGGQLKKRLTVLIC